MNRFWKYKIDHIVFWAATVGFHMFTRLDMIKEVGFDQFMLEVVVRNCLLALLIYFNLLVLIPKYAQQKKIASYIFLLLGSLGLYTILKNSHDVYLHGYVLDDESRR